MTLFSIWLTELKSFSIWLKEFNFSCVPIWLKELNLFFSSISLKELCVCFFDMTQRVELFFWMWLKRVEQRWYDSYLRSQATISKACKRLLVTSRWTSPTDREGSCVIWILPSTGRGTSPPWSAPRSPLRSWNMCHQCLPRHALRLLRVHQFKNKMSSPLRRVHRSVFNRALSNKLYACQSLRYRSKWSCREFQGLRLWSGYRNKLRRLLRRFHRSVRNSPLRRTNCARASPSDTGASDRVGNSRGSGCGADPVKACSAAHRWTNCARASPHCAGANDSAGNSKSSSCQADPGEHCGDHSTGACSAAHRWTNCARVSPYCAGANLRAGKIRGSGYGTDPGTHCGVFWSGGAWSVATRLVDGSIRTSGFLMMLSLIAAPRLLIHVYGIEKCNLSTKSSWTKCWHEEPWWCSAFLSQDSGRKLIVRACCLAPWDNAKKYISAGDLEPDQDKGSDTHKKTVTGDTVGDPLNGHIWPCFVKYEDRSELQHRVWVSHCCASNPNEVHFECGLRELLVFFQCLAFLVWSWWIKSLILCVWNLTGMIIRSFGRVQKIWLTELNLFSQKKWLIFF